MGDLPSSHGLMGVLQHAPSQKNCLPLAVQTSNLHSTNHTSERSMQSKIQRTDKPIYLGKNDTWFRSCSNHTLNSRGFSKKI
jgi:hypothetical protein